MVRRNPIPEPPQVFDPDPDLREDAEKRAVVSQMMGVTEGQFTVVETEGEPVQDEEIEVAERAVAVVPPVGPSHHVVTGMATLAAMDEGEFRSRIAIMKAGQERLRIIQQELLIEGEDYGKVNGIERPFLHLPGAEKLCNIYGLAVRQETRRIMGTYDSATEKWLTPPLSYMTTSYVHLGGFDGPIVAQGEGEANSWEEKYRYRWSKPSCPRCGHEMMKGGNDGKMRGKWFCPGFKGGCWNAIEITATNPDGTPVITPPTKVDNPDPYGLAETLVQMSAKRSFVAATRRATGTSGLFTQDEDSPSVRQQAGDDGTEDQPEPVIETATIGVQVQPGAKIEGQTQVQQNRLKELVKQQELSPIKIADLLTVLFGTEVETTGPGVSAAVRALTGEQMGRLIHAVETGEIPGTASPSMSDGDDSEMAGAGIGSGGK